MKQALIIFARKPEKGKVKTRLAAQIGEEQALTVYIRLLEHTRAVASAYPCDKYVFLTDEVADVFWKDFYVERQADGDLGERMSAAFQLLFDKGYQQVVIIGSDCPVFSINHLNEAFAALYDVDVVIGPATDGGYYLLGMKLLYSELFLNKTWSTDRVLRDTIYSINELQLTFQQLEPLTDVDEATDLPEGWMEVVR
ncbi:MAG TPA: TIGR04282 family arsenosugar biosynthesis glycosyltransferase [Flavisolibacter sp.]|nr:TIGR04282 family arsenosugar biosynthesis glycosyltransferase [Flavisolibacter sp.]